MAREKGIVKWFSTDKGYGFIRRESGDEIFVHHTDIEVDGYASLKNGETVEFDVFESDRGPKARNLVPMEADGSAAAPRPKPGSRERGSRAEGGSRKGRGRTDGGRRSSRSESTPASGSAGAKKSLAEMLRERLGKRFPGFRA